VNATLAVEAYIFTAWCQDWRWARFNIPSNT